MKKSELKEYIKEIILAELEENEAYKVMGRTGETAVQSFPNSTSANKFKSENPNIASIKKLEETEDEEPTQADIQKEKSLTKAQTEWTKITKELKSNVSKIKDIISKKPADRTKADEDLLTKMKELTKRKNQLKSKFSELDDEN
jgi:hypothetical protein